jgi:fatty-acyl-CoA synthase
MNTRETTQALLTVPQAVATHAAVQPRKVGARDSSREISFAQWHERSCRLANALRGLGLARGERVAVLAYNCVEWAELYVAVGLAGLVAVPVNFRLLAPEVRYIVEDCEARALIVQHALLDRVEPVRAEMQGVAGRCIHFGAADAPAGWLGYEALIAGASASPPDVQVGPRDTWAFMYTSGTTGKPKGAIRSHASQSMIGLVTALDMGFGRDDTGLLVMPMCHANSLNFFSAFAYLGATCHVYDRASFDAEHLLQTFAEHQVSFTSLVPTHYVMMLSLPDAVKARYRTASVTRLLISSAPARRDTKLAIMEHFRSSRLFELYGSTEAGWATLLRPDEQLTKLGSIGREWTGSGRIRLLDADGRDVPEGAVGELFSHTPYAFDGYWKLPEKTAESLRGPYCSVGDMARRDEDGYYHLVDRKSNMIISGGENVYPSEIENLLGGHPKVKDVAVVGLPDDKWGEAVHAVLVLRDGESATDAEILDWCRERMAGYKRPRSVSFLRDDEMPRTGTGKILHRVLRERVKR